MAEGTCDAAAVLLAHNTVAVITARGGSNIDLGVSIIRITPTPAFEESVRSGDLTQDGATWQMAARINDTAPELTHI